MQNNKYKVALNVYNCLYNTNYRVDKIKSNMIGHVVYRKLQPYNRGYAHTKTKDILIESVRSNNLN